MSQRYETQEQLAEAADLHVGFLGSVERGKKNISLLNIVELARAVQATPSELLSVLKVTTTKT